MITSKDMERMFLEALKEEIEGKESEIRSLKRKLDKKEREAFVEAAASIIRRMMKVMGDSGLTARINCQQWEYTISDGSKFAKFNARVLETE